MFRIFIITMLFSSSGIFSQRLEIYGFIFTKPDSLPIKGAQVKLFKGEDSLIQTIHTDEKGQFIFNRVSTGTY